MCCSSQGVKSMASRVQSERVDAFDLLRLLRIHGLAT
jgi:hypothetical protein